MSAISSIGSYGQSLITQQLQQRNDPDNDGDVHNGQGAQGFKTRFEAAAKAAGADPTKLDSIFAQVQQAIQNVPQSTTGSDRRTAFQQAVNSVLQSNGIDPSKFQTALSANRTGHHRRHGQGGGTDTNSVAATSNPTTQTESTTLLNNLAAGAKIDTNA